MNRVLNSFGIPTSRGSSTRGGVRALKGLIDLARKGYMPSFAVDGPKGPLHKVKPGVIALSKELGIPIVPVAMVCSRSYCFKKSWNKAVLPLPFARVVIYFGKIQPYEDPLILESEIIRAEEAASKFIASPKARC